MTEFFLLPSLPKISLPIEGTATWTDVAFYFMPGAEQWYRYQSRSRWQAEFGYTSSSAAIGILLSEYFVGFHCVL
jgi:hypothetical protein